MKKRTSTIESYMTSSPQSIGYDQTLRQAHDLMREHQIRHLPVLQGGKLVGILSQRDLALIESLGDVEPDEVMVEEAMTREVFSVAPDAPLEDVALEMADRKLGSAVVVRGNEVVGVFTTVDALRALSELLRGE
jgi:acetoin utilization protein AcuB